MYLLMSCLALISYASSSLADVSNATPALASRVNPYYDGRNPLAPGYSPFYNPASATVPILSYSNNHGTDGSYSFSFTTGDGKQAQETGFLKDTYIDKTGTSQGTQVIITRHQVKEGSYGYTSPEGIPIQVSYVADENGFRHAGVRIPANGKGVAPNPLFNGFNGARPFDSRYNPYNPYNSYNHYNNYNPYNSYNPYNPYKNYGNRVGEYGQNNLFRPFDPRYPYDPRYNFNNQYQTAPIVSDKTKNTHV